MPLPFLSGIRVLDLSQYIPGPYAAQILGDLGATVVKVEPPAGDPMRRFDPPDPDGLPAAYKLLNAGKTVVMLDLKSDAARAAFERLVARADVLVESYRPGTLDRLGFGRARLEALNPGLVHVAISGWGQDGPYRLKAGHDLTYMALGGALAGSGPAERPAMSYPPVSDHAAAIQAALAVAAALFGRSRTGRGAFLDVSMMETVLGWQGVSLTRAARGDPPTRGAELLTGGTACYNIYRCADGRFAALGAIEDKFWSAFCTAVGRPDWIARQWEPRPQTALIGEVSALFAGQPLAHWTARLDPADCCFEPVAGFAGVPANPQVAARGQIRRHGGPAPLLETLLGLRVDGGPPPERAPLRPADVDTVLREWTA